MDDHEVQGNLEVVPGTGKLSGWRGQGLERAMGTAREALGLRLRLTGVCCCVVKKHEHRGMSCRDANKLPEAPEPGTQTSGL